MKNKETQRLKDRFQDQQEQRENERKSHEPNANERMAVDTPDWISTYDFWCDGCEEDFSSPAWKTVHRLYGDPITCYRAVHERCGEICTRLVSHRDQDQYYQKSEKIRRQRSQYMADMLRPGQAGFSTLYGRPGFDKMQQEMEEDVIKRERERGLKGLSIEVAEELGRIRNG